MTELTDDSAVVIIGSGAGGGTLAYELTARGIPNLDTPQLSSRRAPT